MPQGAFFVAPDHDNPRDIAFSKDGRKMRIRNRFFRQGELCASVDSFVLWFDIRERKNITPPEELLRIWNAVERTEDFEELPSRA